MTEPDPPVTHIGDPRLPVRHVIVVHAEPVPGGDVPGEWLSKREVRSRLGLTPEDFDAVLKLGELDPHRRVGRKVEVHVSAVSAYEARSARTLDEALRRVRQFGREMQQGRNRR